ncbi:2OG-Fe(II) oxygenase [Labilithrix luteola]|nr:2OG-Fe(II) oxygenase [Labilithrix luteola]
MPIERDRPRAHLVVDDFFPPAALEVIFREVRSLERKMKPGLVRDVGHDGQSVFFENERRKNKAVWIHDPSKTLRLFRDRFWSPPMLEAFANAREPLFQIIPNCRAPHLQVSAYMTGDHYDFHEDEGAGVNLTAIVFLASRPEKVRGGDLVLAYGGEETTVRFRHNRLVVFPSKTLHRVTRVRVDSKDVHDARLSLQCWLTYGEEPRRAKARAPEADRPTFLLSEEPIIAVAQALVDSSATADQSPEELYWGAFYLSRILSSNLRFLVEAAGCEFVGPIRIRRGETLDVLARARHDGSPLTIGFQLRGPEVGPSEALGLFVEKGRGRSVSLARKQLPAGADEETTVAILRRLLVAKGTTA